MLVICKLVLGLEHIISRPRAPRSSRCQVNFARTEQSFGKPVDKNPHVVEGGGTGLKRLKGFGGRKWTNFRFGGANFFLKENIHPRKLPCPLKRDYFSREYIWTDHWFSGALAVSFQGEVSLGESWWANTQPGWAFVPIKSDEHMGNKVTTNGKLKKLVCFFLALKKWIGNEWFLICRYFCLNCQGFHENKIWWD